MRLNINKILKKILIGLLILPIIVLLILFAGLNLLANNACENTLIKQIPLKNDYKAILFSCDCGATTSVSMQVSILKGQLENKIRGNVFISETEKPITIARDFSGNLIIHYKPDFTKVYKQEHKFKGIAVSYDPQ